MRIAPRLASLAAVVLLSVLILASPAAAHPARPTAPDAALRDGCQRSDFGIGFDTSPEWVYVYRNPAIRVASGVVRIVHGSLEDSILQHRSYDFNANLVPDPAYRYLIAGSPSAQTHNYAPDEGEARGRLHFEWETATLPFFAWPADGDRATLWGSWIWDCGHWQSTSNNTGGTTTGEHTELHPLNAIVVNRRASYLSPSGESETDVFISNQGDGAHAVEQCALSHHPLTGAPYPQYDPGYEPCSTSTANRIQPLEPSYTFFVPAPPKPAAGSQLHYRMVNRVSGGSGSQQVRIGSAGITVTVRVPNSRQVVRYGKSFFVSWSAPPRRLPTALRITFGSLLIHHADPNPAVPDPSGANWALYLDVNGYWQLLNNWAPQLTSHVYDGERIAINRSVRIYVPAGAPVWLEVQGRECDEPAGRTVLGVNAHELYPCPANVDELNPNILDVFANDDPGTILRVYPSAAAAVGRHLATAAAVVNFPGTGSTYFGDVPQGQDGYQLNFTVAQVRSAAARRGTRSGRPSVAAPPFPAGPAGGCSSLAGGEHVSDCGAAGAARAVANRRPLIGSQAIRPPRPGTQTEIAW